MKFFRLPKSAGLVWITWVMAGLAGTSATAVAQGGSNYVYMLHSDTPGVPDFDIRTVHHGFQLFAAGDAGSMGFRLTGAFSPKMDNYSPCSNTLYSCQNVAVKNTFNNVYNGMWFHLEWAYGVPPSEFRKIKAVAPSISNALGGGWSAGSNDMVLGRPNRFGPRDGTLGTLFAGVASTTDGGCRDFQGRGNGSHPGGIPLLAGSGCPETWPTTGWAGDAPIDKAGWQAQLAATGAAFTWDFWRVPTSRKRTDKIFMGTGWSTYGETSDFYRQILAAYGSVVPGGSGPPGLEGYPLGLVLRFESFTFGVPSMSGIQFIQTMIINRSQDVWGSPIDYDSLYFGLSFGVLLSIPSSSNYYLPQFNTALMHNRGATSGVAGGPCTQAFRTPTGVGSCPAAANFSSGYRNGANIIVILKSPLGDYRNKLFTRNNGTIVNGVVQGGTACVVGIDPFCNPAHPNRGDTITFTRGGQGGFGNVDSYTWGTGAQATFGYISGQEKATAAGRNLSDAGANVLYRLFGNPGYPGVIGIYNKYAPGQGGQPGAAWDWNHDGIPDTLALDTCEKKGCVQYSSDTMPGGQINNSGNVGGILAFGPFKLKAGDTTSFVFAQIGGADSSDAWTMINNAIDSYMNFYISPEAPAVSRVRSTQVVPSSDATGTITPSVRLFWSDDAEHWTDQYLAKLAADMRAAVPTSPLGILLADNPRNVTTNTPPLDTLILNIAKDNLEAIEIYKSCDAGLTFTATSDCAGQPTFDDHAKPVGLGWAPYASFNVTANAGNPPNTLTDVNVRGGRTYLYTIVGKSRGAAFNYNRRVGGIQCGLAGSTCVPDTIRFEPSIRNVLSTFTQDANVASVYVPVSNPAGYLPAAVNITTPDARVTLPMTFTFTSAPVPGVYRVVFGNKFIVRRDSLISKGSVTTYVIAQDTIVADTSGGKNLGVSVVNLVKSDTLARATHDVLPADPGGAAVTTVGPARTAPGSDTVRTTNTYKGAIGYVVAKTTTPIWLSLFPAAATSVTPAPAVSLADYPGFAVSAQESNAGLFNPLSYSNTAPVLSPQASEFQLRGAASIARNHLTLTDTIVPRTIVNKFMVQWEEANSARVNQGSGTALSFNSGVGRYEADWLGDPWGTQTGFVLNQANPTATQAQVVASLRARPIGQIGQVDTIAARLLGQPIEDLVAVKLPFILKNLTSGRPVSVAMLRRLDNTVLLGNGSDTLRITVPADQWVPGDVLQLIENVTTDSVTPKGTMVTPGGVTAVAAPSTLVTPVLLTARPTRTFSSAMLGCQNVRNSCNPVPQGTPGATGYDPMYAGDRTQWEYYSGFRPDTRVTLSVVGPLAGTSIAQLTDSMLSLVRVVPNPYVLYSQYPGADAATSQLMFTGLPGAGTLRIYTLAGQFVQVISWTAADLQGNGDLFYDLKSRGGLRISTGLYLWVLTTLSQPNDASSATLTARGKFVVIQGQPR